VISGLTRQRVPVECSPEIGKGLGECLACCGKRQNVAVLHRGRTIDQCEVTAAIASGSVATISTMSDRETVSKTSLTRSWAPNKTSFAPR